MHGKAKPLNFAPVNKHIIYKAQCIKFMGLSVQIIPVWTFAKSSLTHSMGETQYLEGNIDSNVLYKLSPTLDWKLDREWEASYCKQQFQCYIIQMYSMLSWWIHSDNDNVKDLFAVFFSVDNMKTIMWRLLVTHFITQVNFRLISFFEAPQKRKGNPQKTTNGSNFITTFTIATES